MQVSDELLERFFRKQCTPEEEQQVRLFLGERLDRLEKAPEPNWAAGEFDATLRAEVSEKMLAVIDAGIQPAGVRRIYLGWAAAAAVIVIGLGWWIRADKTHAVTTPSVAAHAATHAATHHYKERINRTGKTMLLTLPDSSRVELANNSSIKYDEAFPRAISLEGKALFAVVASVSRPFSVSAGGLTTTALGTVFSLSYKNGSSATEVSLISGKVVIRPDSALRSHGIKETFLSSGQQLSFEPAKLTLTVHSPKPALAAARPVPVPAAANLQFNNTLLKDIFHTLEKECRCQLHYSHADIDSIRFTGSFNGRKETLSDFLNTIAILNNLTFTERNGAYYLK